MFKISKNLSCTITSVLCIVLFAALLFGAAFAGEISARFLRGVEESGLLKLSQTLVTAALYAIIVTAQVADILLIMILRRVTAGVVFSSQSVSLIRGVSWLCMLECLFLAFLGLCFPFFFCLSIAALLLGMTLRVVKNVIEEATEIKSENDLTV